jgi:hypothetical protein
LTKVDGGNDNKADAFVFEIGTGKDFVHDFEIGLDLIDLSDVSADFEAV